MISGWVLLRINHIIPKVCMQNSGVTGIMTEAVWGIWGSITLIRYSIFWERMIPDRFRWKLMPHSSIMMQSDRGEESPIPMQMDARSFSMVKTVIRMLHILKGLTEKFLKDSDLHS